MLTLELDDDEMPDTVEVHEDGRVTGVKPQKGDPVYESWSEFCEHYDVDPGDLLEEVIDQIDPGVRAEVDARDIDEPDDYLKACARLTKDED
ncbi:MAG: hypothetical protein WBY94_19825 [Polyangiaceae bacterium]